MTTPRFIDSDGRTWPIEISVQTVRELRRELDIDLYEPPPEAIRKLNEDPVYLADFIFIVCSHTCKERGVTDEDFGRCLRSPGVIESASEAVHEAIVLFIPPSQVATRILMRDAALARMLGKLTAAILRDGSMNPPACSESTPAATA